MADEAPCLVAVGDSITQAEPPWLSWRYYLWQSLLDAGMHSIARIGSQCKSTRLEPYQIRNLTQNSGGHGAAEKRRFAQLKQRQTELETQLERQAVRDWIWTHETRGQSF